MPTYLIVYTTLQVIVKSFISPMYSDIVIGDMFSTFPIGFNI